MLLNSNKFFSCDCCGATPDLLVEYNANFRYCEQCASDLGVNDNFYHEFRFEVLNTLFYKNIALKLRVFYRKCSCCELEQIDFFDVIATDFLTGKWLGHETLDDDGEWVDSSGIFYDYNNDSEFESFYVLAFSPDIKKCQDSCFSRNERLSHDS